MTENCRALAPPPETSSLLETYVQPLAGPRKQAPPSGASCHGTPLPATGCPERATTRLREPLGSRTPFASGASSAP